MNILVVDGQGGGIGKALIEKLVKSGANEKNEIIAVGTNSAATLAMSRAGAKKAATGENAVVYNAKRAHIIAGSAGILLANSMLGELTSEMSDAISESDAEKVLIPLNRCGLHVAGVADMSLPELIDEAAKIILSLAAQ